MSEEIEWENAIVIGKGGSSTVFLAKQKGNDRKIAIKQIETDGLTNSQINGIQGEIETMRSLSHPNIVSFLGSTQKPEKIYIILEYADRGSLRSFYRSCGRLSEVSLKYCLVQILRGLQYLHEKGIAHRDVKCANCLLSSTGSVKLADFGASKRFESDSIVSGLKGTPHWMAPEVIRGTQMTTGWMNADVWSLGCTVVEMITGKVPYSAYENPMTAMYRIASGEIPSLGNDLEVSSALRSFVEYCCANDPNERPAVGNLIAHFLLKDCLDLPYDTDIFRYDYLATTLNTISTPTAAVSRTKNSSEGLSSLSPPKTQISSTNTVTLQDGLMTTADSENSVDSFSSCNNTLRHVLYDPMQFNTSGLSSGIAVLDSQPNDISPPLSIAERSKHERKVSISDPFDSSGSTEILHTESLRLSNPHSKSKKKLNSTAAATSSPGPILRQASPSNAEGMTSNGSFFGYRGRANTDQSVASNEAPTPLLHATDKAAAFNLMFSPGPSSFGNSLLRSESPAANIRQTPVSKSSGGNSNGNGEVTLLSRAIENSSRNSSRDKTGVSDETLNRDTALRYLHAMNSFEQTDSLQGTVRSPRSNRKLTAVQKSESFDEEQKQLQVFVSVSEKVSYERPFAPLSGEKLRIHSDVSSSTSSSSSVGKTVHVRKDSSSDLLERIGQSGAAAIRKIAHMEVGDGRNYTRTMTKQSASSTPTLGISGNSAGALYKRNSKGNLENSVLSPNYSDTHRYSLSNQSPKGQTSILGASYSIRSQSAGLALENTGDFNGLHKRVQLPPMGSQLHLGNISQKTSHAGNTIAGGNSASAASGPHHRYIQSAPAISRAVNLPPLTVQSATPDKYKLQQSKR